MLSVHINKQQSNCLDFTQMDLCFRQIKVINNIPATVKFISKLYLNGNYLMSLNGIEQFCNLQVFHFNYNLISLTKEINKITNPFFLKDISFIANPIYYCKRMNLHTLRQLGFRRLERMNAFQSIYQSPRKIAGKIKHINQFQKSNSAASRHDYTVRRVPSYKDSPQYTKTNRKLVGKIYLNTKFTTDRIRQKQPQHSKQTRQSTNKPHLQESRTIGRSSSLDELREGNIEEVKAFEHSMDESEETAKFSGSFERLGQEFISQQKERLADIYYKRSILQKYFNLLKQTKRVQTIEQQMQSYQGQLLNNNIETLHFSLIKLKHNFIHRT